MTRPLATAVVVTLMIVAFSLLGSVLVIGARLNDLDDRVELLETQADNQ